MLLVYSDSRTGMRISTKMHNYSIAYTWRKSRVNQEVDEVICIKLFQDKDKDQGRMKVKDGRSKSSNYSLNGTWKPLP